MTRINTVPPRALSDAHVLVEIHEIPRVPTLALKRLRNNRPIDQGDRSYTLGPGHVTFFYDKIAYLRRRLDELCDEAERRGFSDKRRIDDGRWAECQSFQECWNDWNPDKDAIEHNLQRLNEKIESSTVKPRWYRKTYEKSEFLSTILNRESRI